MKKGKYTNNGRSHRGATGKTLALMLSLILIVGSVTGGTLAWLLDDTGPVVNEFTNSDIEVGLEESDNLDLKMIPGWTITKDPKAWIETGSEDSFLFVKVEKSDNFDSFMTFEIADGWTPLTGVDGVYYREIIGNDAMGKAHYILKDNKVTVLGTVTKDMMDAIAAGTAEEPTLTFTAYAHQLYENNSTKFEAAEAWSNLNPTTP